MRILIKGGVWRNTEDEILKAAVMKYGLNQWARISSLLVRKSAKQCKARWYEWLDPSIKKTEWTREEDEKLLHLAKLMPTQWRTIAPIVGRTPAQCLERYEKLLDMAAAKNEDYDAKDDPRRLRPGEIDPNPESKPARPDPVDMDEDEKEMLSEARARLANTRGKKAKRKAREKQLEEARRLAALQKKRELKAAGIELRERHKSKRTVDYNAEVAFERRPAAGFFDVNEEDERSKQQSLEFRPVTLEQMEGKRRKDIEAALMKSDVARAKMLERHDQPAALAKASEMNDPSLVVRRGKLMLPAPQVSESELEAIARGGGGMEVDEELAAGAGGDATRTLLGSYQAAARLPTDLRTPRMASGSALGGDRILQQAENLARLSTAQTPLAGGANPELHPSDFSGITPKVASAQTPNPLAAGLTPASVRGSVGATPSLTGATPSGRAIAGISATPLHGGATPGATPSAAGLGATPMRTPMRDELGLNEPDSLMAADKRAERARIALQRNELRAGLAQLPKPSMEYAIEVPELPEEEGPEGVAMEEDAADRAARLAAQEEAARQAELRKRSQVLQRGLPRPATLDLLPEPKATPASLREAAESLLHAEMAALLEHEAARFPLRERKKKRGREPEQPPPLQEFAEQELSSASTLVRAEAEALRRAMGHEGVAAEEYLEVWQAAAKEVVYVPSQQAYMRASAVSNTDRVAGLQAEFEAARKEMEREALRAGKLEGKVTIVTRGLIAREAELKQQLEELQVELDSAGTEQRCFGALAEVEERTAPARIAALQGVLAAAREREDSLQKRYKMLAEQRDDLRAALAPTAAVH